MQRDWAETPTLKHEGVGDDWIRVVRRIALVEQRLKAVENEIQSLETSDLFQLRSKAEEAESEGRHLFEEMESQVMNQIDEAKNRLEGILQTRVAS